MKVKYRVELKKVNDKWFSLNFVNVNTNEVDTKVIKTSAKHKGISTYKICKALYQFNHLNWESENIYDLNQPDMMLLAELRKIDHNFDIKEFETKF